MMNIPIITYHALGNLASPLWTPIETFEAHLKALADSGYRTTPLATLLGYLHNRQPLPQKTLALTFDDGYQSFYAEAWPRLQHYDFSATVFLISDYCDCNNRWDEQPSSVPDAPLLSWKEVEKLAAQGCEFGAHTRSHPALPTLLPEVALEEMVSSQEKIQKHIGQAVRVFAYPYGATNVTVTEMVKQHFDGAVSTELGLVQAGSDPYFLSRIDAYYLRPALIPLMQHVLFQKYLSWRQILRSLRRSIYADWGRR